MKKVLNIIFAVPLILCAYMIPFNFILGSFKSIFSFSTIVAPVAAKHCGLSFLTLFFLSKSAFSVLSIPLFLLHRLPLLVASRAFLKREILTSFIIPAVCMVLFVYHPVGGTVKIYSYYWFIPMALFWCKKSLFVRALSASFSAHAVGSVIWLYTGTIPADVWLSLLAIVAVERLFIAVGMICCDYIFARVVTYSHRLIVQKILIVRQFVSRLGVS